jgi:predicted adenine nucleotide alpha hydrolase (AANH) superfamily ATPase
LSLINDAPANHQTAHFKVSIFSSQDFDFFKSPSFLGSKYILAVAYEDVPKNSSLTARSYLSVLEIKAGERKKAQADETEFISSETLTKLCEELLEKMPREITITALFDCRSLAAHSDTSALNSEKTAIDFKWQGRKALHLTGKYPPLLERSQECAQNFLLLKQKERMLLAPDIKWQETDPLKHSLYLERKSLRKFYDLSHPEISNIIQEIDRKKKILVHVCCGPDAAGVIEQLQEEFEVLCFWYDPNIQPKEEYDLRLEAFEKVAKLKNTKSIIGEYDVENFFENIKGLEHTPEQGAKCSVCYDMRLERSALEAKKQNCDLFTTTLAISPHKVQQKLKAFGEVAAKRHGVPYLARNFMKHEGFKESVKFTIENDIYRQDYCGCLYSLHEGGPKARQMAAQLGLATSSTSSK